ncbi:unnamed protein product [Brassicogethes aeneus]|uniref:Uncharacterized protein n=1 Tax=Brassicogethes aeneus TaxID=1431903 RepID=A0A9P0BA34_BRAAE|nr:unnamed protein product [Brassicogethes aeneus]
MTAVASDFPDVTRFILWSDSCVPQNKNSVMTVALKKFLQENPNILQITQKFCEPGHSSIQEVDNVHSQIEKKLANMKIYSPLGLLRALKEVNRKSPFYVSHMQLQNFKDYQGASKSYNFKNIPYCALKVLKYLSNKPMQVYFKLSHSEVEDFKVCSIVSQMTRKNSAAAMVNLPVIKICSAPRECLLPEDKVYCLYKLFKYLPEVDKTYIRTLFYQYKDEQNIKKLKKKFKSLENENNPKLNKKSESKTKPNKNKDKTLM